MLTFKRRTCSQVCHFPDRNLPSDTPFRANFPHQNRGNRKTRVNNCWKNPFAFSLNFPLNSRTWDFRIFLKKWQPYKVAWNGKQCLQSHAAKSKHHRRRFFSKLHCPPSPYFLSPFPHPTSNQLRIQGKSSRNQCIMGIFNPGKSQLNADIWRQSTKIHVTNLFATAAKLGGYLNGAWKVMRCGPNELGRNRRKW